MQYQQGGDYTSPYYPNPYTSTTPSYPNPSPTPNPTPTPTPNANPNPNPMDFSSPNMIQSSYASAPPYTPYPPEFPSGPNYSYPQPPQTQYQPQFQTQSSQFPSYPPQNPTQYPPDPSPSPSPAPASYYQNFSPPNPSSYPSVDVPYETGTTNRYGRSTSTFEPDLYSKKPYEEPRNEGVYAYSGGSDEPYGARGIMGNSAARSNSSSNVLFDDFGRSISMPSGGKDRGKIVKAVPKMDAQPDVKSGVQKFRVKLLPEGAGSNMDVLCQVGLDGIKMLDPSTSRTLRIYPLETLTRWEVLDSSIFAFWSKTSVDVEPRRIRLKSNSYTTSTILDSVTAATVQFKEIWGGHLSRGRAASDTGKAPEPTAEKKKGLWVNFIKPPEEKDHWVPDEAVSKCTSCGADFGAFVRRHHCRNCGDIFCDKCTQGRIALTSEENAQPVRVCDRCMAEVSQRLNNAKEAANRPIVHSHEDLARKLQEEMDKNRKSFSASKSESGRMRDVVCPVCTVHLQVQVPASGSETIECGVCQHPFRVSAH